MCIYVFCYVFIANRSVKIVKQYRNIQLFIRIFPYCCMIVFVY